MGQRWPAAGLGALSGAVGAWELLKEVWQPIPVFLPGKSHGQRSLTGYSPRGRKSGTQLSDFTSTIIFITSTKVWPQVSNREGTQPHQSTEN